MKFFIAAMMAAVHVRAETPEHTVYNCQHIRMNVDEANAMLENDDCDPEVNCAPFSYDNGKCWDTTEEVCDGDSWYSTGRENFRCSTKTGGRRLGRYGSNDATGSAESGGWPGACTCNEFCQELAAEQNETLTAFDMYSGKCRCWAGTCDYDNSLPCRNGGDDYGVGSANNGGSGDPSAGNNWRCPSQIYFPEPMEDCDGNDITFHWANIQEYIGDGHCDDGSTPNQEYAFSITNTLSFNLNCPAFENDGGDCQLDCHQSIYWATNFVELDTSYSRVDECAFTTPQQTEWTTACDCYEFCAGFATDVDEDFLFDHDHLDNCRCWFGAGDLASLTDTTFCGLNSDCQIYQPDRQASCSDVDFTLGIYDGAGTFGEDSEASSVESYQDYISSSCIEDAMCSRNGFSQGSCFDCDRFSTDEQADRYCSNEAEFYAQVSNSDLDDLIAFGVLNGADPEDTSTGGNNCACLNFCFSAAIESGMFDTTGDFYEQLNVIAEIDAAYATRNETCTCYSNCDETTACGTTAGDCTSDAIVWHSTVADLNIQS